MKTTTALLLTLCCCTQSKPASVDDVSPSPKIVDVDSCRELGDAARRAVANNVVYIQQFAELSRAGSRRMSCRRWSAVREEVMLSESRVRNWQECVRNAGAPNDAGPNALDAAVEAMKDVDTLCRGVK